MKNPRTVETSPDMLELTARFWAARTGRECSYEEARQMVSNVTGFFTVLAEWDRKSREEIHQRPEAKKRERKDQMGKSRR